MNLISSIRLGRVIVCECMKSVADKVGLDNQCWSIARDECIYFPFMDISLPDSIVWSPISFMRGFLFLDHL